MVKDLVVTRSIMLQASPERVWEVLTDPIMTRQYMNECSISSDWQVGSPVHWKNHQDQVAYKGSLVDYAPGKSFKYTYYDIHSGDEDHPSSYVHVCYNLLPKNGLTELQVTLTNFGGDDTRAEHAAANWDFEVLPKLKTLAEARTMAIMH
jgi:uncharacterized protein YndB with AHSA1/START domain